MKKIIFMISILVLFLCTEGTTALSDGENKKVNIIVRPFIDVVREFPEVKIIPGESEQDKKERKLLEEKARTVLARSRPDYTSVRAYSSDDLKALYKEAAAKFGIDWKLIEAVHQVETGKSIDTCKTSYAGATGPMQFMPSTFRTYKNEGDNICGLRDSVFAAANLLASGGANRGDIDSALFNYNHSWSYVQKVKSVMNNI